MQWVNLLLSARTFLRINQEKSEGREDICRGTKRSGKKDNNMPIDCSLIPAFYVSRVHDGLVTESHRVMCFTGM